VGLRGSPGATDGNGADASICGRRPWECNRFAILDGDMGGWKTTGHAARRSSIDACVSVSMTAAYAPTRCDPPTGFHGWRKAEQRWMSCALH
jgi:hypothetical protein